MSTSYNTPQEDFWAGEFGNDYVSRNDDQKLIASKAAMFSSILRRTGPLSSVVELGCNIGINLSAISRLLPGLELSAVEINSEAAEIARNRLPEADISTGSLFDYAPGRSFELAFTCGVMIHLSPDMLQAAYQKLGSVSSKHVLIAEYYNPTPVTIPYRGHDDRLFKRDFAGEFLIACPEYSLRNYGFVYHKDPAFPLDDVTWFLMTK